MTEQTLVLPCGCENHVNCLLDLAESGKLGRIGKCKETIELYQYKCLNPKCLEKFNFKTGEEFWKYAWSKIKSPPRINKNIYEPKCGHQTYEDVAGSYYLYLTNITKNSSGMVYYSNSVLEAYEKKSLCAICDINK